MGWSNRKGASATTAQGENCTDCRQRQNWLCGVGAVVKMLDSILDAKDAKISLNDIKGERGSDTDLCLLLCGERVVGRMEAKVAMQTKS